MLEYFVVTLTFCTSIGYILVTDFSSCISVNIVCC